MGTMIALDLFAKAARLKLRFESGCGLLCVEDLWDLPLTDRYSRGTRGMSLDELARNLYHALQATEVSFVDEPAQANTLAQLRFDVVKSVIDVKKEERQLARDEADKAARKAKLLEVLAKKQDAALEGHSMEELEQMIAAL
jgi:hypothetical protein